MVRFNDLRSLNVKTGLSYQYMFAGVMTEKEIKAKAENKVYMQQTVILYKIQQGIST